MGMRKTEVSTYYIKQMDWKKSPEVWKTMAQFTLYGFVAGAIATAILTSGGHKAATPAPTVTVTVTSAP